MTRYLSRWKTQVGNALPRRACPTEWHARRFTHYGRPYVCAPSAPWPLGSVICLGWHVGCRHSYTPPPRSLLRPESCVLQLEAPVGVVRWTDRGTAAPLLRLRLFPASPPPYGPPPPLDVGQWIHPHPHTIWSLERMPREAREGRTLREARTVDRRTREAQTSDCQAQERTREKKRRGMARNVPAGHRSAFGIQYSMFSMQHSAFGSPCSIFNTWRSLALFSTRRPWNGWCPWNGRFPTWARRHEVTKSRRTASELR